MYTQRILMIFEKSKGINVYKLMYYFILSKNKKQRWSVHQTGLKSFKINVKVLDNMCFTESKQIYFCVIHYASYLHGEQHDIGGWEFGVFTHLAQRNLLNIQWHIMQKLPPKQGNQAGGSPHILNEAEVTQSPIKTQKHTDRYQPAEAKAIPQFIIHHKQRSNGATTLSLRPF